MTRTRAEAHTRGSVPSRLRIRILERDGYRCVYCGATPIQAYLHVDHVVPKARGGVTEPKNLVTACGDCNQGKGDLPLALPAGFVPGPLLPERPRSGPARLRAAPVP